MARKKKHEEHENHERWLVSYADFITLLFAFFVVMYSISSVNEGKYRVLSDTLSQVFTKTDRRLDPVQFGEKPQGAMRLPIPSIVESNDNSVNPLQGTGQAANRYKPAGSNDPLSRKVGNTDVSNTLQPGGKRLAVEKIGDEIENSLATLIDQDLLSVRRHSNALEVELKSKVLFAPGSATLSINAEKILIKLAAILSKFPTAVQVEGHTDDQPSASALFPSNWELSAARAATVAHLFAEHRLDTANLWATGYGEYRPLVDNTSEENRVRNRRVVLWIRRPDDYQPPVIDPDKADQLNSLPERPADTAEPLEDGKVSPLNTDPTALNSAEGAALSAGQTQLNAEAAPDYQQLQEQPQLPRPAGEAADARKPIPPAIRPIQLPIAPGQGPLSLPHNPQGGQP